MMLRARQLGTPLAVALAVASTVGSTIAPHYEARHDDPARDTVVHRITATAVSPQDNTSTSTEMVPFATVTTDDPTRAAGTTLVTRAGTPGVQRTVTFTVGAATSAITLVVTPAVDQLETTGSLTIPATTDVAANRALGQELAAARGWGAGEWTCLDALWSRESGWRHNANNSSSGAYGIAQALPGSKMASVGSDWSTNPATQIAWGLNYIASRYATPCGAWSHSQDIGWY